jgi:hypothetical protein
MARTSSSIGNAIEALQRAYDGLQGRGSPEDVLFELAYAERAVTAAMVEQVRRCRKYGLPWSAIGAELGVSKQAAQQRFGRWLIGAHTQYPPPR